MKVKVANITIEVMGNGLPDKKRPDHNQDGGIGWRWYDTNHVKGSPEEAVAFIADQKARGVRHRIIIDSNDLEVLDGRMIVDTTDFK